MVAQLTPEFPATTVSKLRFLDENGLVEPQRTASGYRKYSRADVERIRFVLTRQRDSYAPLKVIQDQLRQLDAGRDLAPVPPARLIASDGALVLSEAARQVSARELTELAGVDAQTIDSYVRLGLISPGTDGLFNPRDARVAAALADLDRAGIPAKLLRSVKQGADRSADIIDQAVSSRENRARARDKERLRARSTELADQFTKLHSLLLASAVEGLLDT